MGKVRLEAFKKKEQQQSTTTSTTTIINHPYNGTWVPLSQQDIATDHNIGSEQISAWGCPQEEGPPQVNSIAWWISAQFFFVLVNTWSASSEGESNVGSAIQFQRFRNDRIRWSVDKKSFSCLLRLTIFVGSRCHGRRRNWCRWRNGIWRYFLHLATWQQALK